MNRSLQVTTAAAALGLGFYLTAAGPAEAQWPGNMGQQMRDAQNRRNQALQSFRNNQGIQRFRNLNRPEDFFVDPDPIPDGQGGAGGQGADGLGADGQGRGDAGGNGQRGNGQRNDPEHHHHHYRFWVDPGLVSPRPLYLRPLDSALPASPPPNVIPDATPTVADDTLLINPKKNGGAISYTLNATRYTMQPGYEQKLPAGRTWTLEFDRGGSFGTARYTLPEGTYAFAVSDRGWDVFRKADANTPVPTAAEEPVVAQTSP